MARRMHQIKKGDILITPKVERSDSLNNGRAAFEWSALARDLSLKNILSLSDAVIFQRTSAVYYF